MGSHSITCHPAEVTFPPLPQPKLVLDEVSRGGPAARRRGEVEQLGDEVDVADRRHALDRPPQRRLVLHQVLRSSLLSFIYLHQTNGPYRVKQATKETHGEPTQTPKIEHKSLRTQRHRSRYNNIITVYYATRQHAEIPQIVQ